MPEACLSTPASRPRLIGFWTCIALVIGNMVGTGIFMLPAQLAPFGANSLWGWLLTIAGALALTEVFALLARALPGVNGPYHFPRLAFGPFAGFVSAWSYWVSIWVSTAAISIGGTSLSFATTPSALKTLTLTGQAGSLSIHRAANSFSDIT